jgi:glycosyltransferase involved in cell wall biosynthesis
MDQDSLIDAGLRNDAVYHIPHGVEERFLDPPAPDTVGDFILHVSKYSPHKNPQAIIKTAKRLNKPVKIAGGGWTENCGDELGQIENVELLGYVSEDRLVELYCAALAFYFPSTYEPFGLPILESMACGTPVVASINSAAPDICPDCISLVDPKQIDQHVDELRQLITDDQLRRSYGLKSKESAKSFTWSHTADQTLNVYEQFVDD